jgi:Ser/Thr protein kinase RdoA (MazF antagonist)
VAPFSQFDALGRRDQLTRLRRLARTALAGYGLGAATMRVLRHEHNTTFRIAARPFHHRADGDYVLRINRPGVHTSQTIAAEMAWLCALRTETGLSVPDPVRSSDGSLVTPAVAAGVPEPRVCVVLRWMDGSFLDARLMPRHLAAVGSLIAGLQDHAAGWIPPTGFVRPRVDALTNAGKVASIASRDASADGAVIPSAGDVEQARALVGDLLTASDLVLFDEALVIARATTATLARIDDSSGLVHGDLHPENVLFLRDDARAIDFDDCGWGFWLYDAAVALWELEGRRRYPEYRTALLEAYARRRSLPPASDQHIAAFSVLRRLQILLWVLESRGHPAFRDDWRPWARKELDGIALAVRRYGG